MIVFKIALVLGFISGALMRRIDWTGTSAFRIVSSAVVDGDRMRSNLVTASDYRVVCTIQVENWTKYPLERPRWTINRGEKMSNPVAILPGTREVFVVRKVDFWASGTYGTVSWFIGSMNLRLVVMWHVPYNLDLYDNKMGIGLTTPSVTDHRDWYNRMYEESNGDGLRFFRGTFTSRHNLPIKGYNSIVELAGCMGPSHTTTVKVIIRPWNDWNLAPRLKFAYNNEPQVSEYTTLTCEHF